VKFNWNNNHIDYVKLNNKDYIKGTLITAGNSTNYNFTIIRTKPTGTLTNVNDKGYANKDVTFSWNINSNVRGNTTATLNGKPYVKGALIKEEGAHVIVLSDLAGNTTTYNFIINKIPPNATFYNYDTQELIDINKRYFSHSISFSFEKNEDYIDYLEINKERASKNYKPIFMLEKKYEFDIITKSGIRNKIEFEINKNLYYDNYYHFNNKGVRHNNVWWNSYDYFFSETAKAYQINNYYSFDNEEDAKIFAINKEKAIIEKGIYKGGIIYSPILKKDITVFDFQNQKIDSSYYIYKSINDANPIAFFSEKLLEEAITHFAIKSITKKMIPAKPYTFYPGDDKIRKQKLSSDIIHLKAYNKFNYHPNDNQLYINGVLSNYENTEIFKVSGIYEITEITKFGVAFSYKIAIDLHPPKIIIQDKDKNNLDDLIILLENNNQIKLTSPVIIFAKDEIDLNPIIKITVGGVVYELFNESFALDKSGTYKIETRDKAGNVLEEKIMLLSLEIPKISFKNKINNDSITEGFTANWENVTNPNKLISIKILLDNVEITRDFTNRKIGIDNKNFYFIKNGKYEFIMLDNFNRVIKETYEFKKENPVGFFSLENNIELTELKTTNKNVKFYWKSESYEALIWFNNASIAQKYNKNTTLKNVGTYKIKLYDISDELLFVEYNFSIDRAKPTGTLTNVNDKGYANKDVTFSKVQRQL